MSGKEITTQRKNPEEPPAIQINGDVKQVDKFKYLRNELPDKHNFDAEIPARVSQAIVSFGHLRSRVLDNTNLRIKTKVAVYTSVCLSTLLCGVGSWTTYQRHIKRLEVFSHQMITAHSRTQMTGQSTSYKSPPEGKANQYRLHVGKKISKMDRTCIPGQCLPRQVLYGQLLEAHRNSGGQKKRYKEQIRKL